MIYKINVKPTCLSKLRGEESYVILDNVVSILNDGRKAVEVLESIDFNESPDSVVDYSLLFDLEDLLLEKETIFNGFGEIDPKDLVKYARNSLLYFNEACDILDVDSCSNTVMECAEMLAKLNFAVANASTFLYNILSELIKYVQYLGNVENPQLSEQTKLQYPEFEDIELVYSPEVLEILRRYGDPEEPKTLAEFIRNLLEIVMEFRTQNTCILSYYSDYAEFYDIIDRYDQVDIQDAMSIVMPQDIYHVLGIHKTDSSVTETVLDNLISKIDGRMGVLEGVQSMSYYELDSLIWLAKYCKSNEDFDKLYVNERIISSDLNKCYLAIARKSIDLVYQPDMNGMNTTNLF